MSCSRKERYRIQHVCETRLADIDDSLDGVVGIETDGKNGPREGREIGTHCSFDNGKVRREESRDDPAVGRVTM